MPVTYTFAPFTVQEIPDVLSGMIQTGDTVYRIASVEQRPDLLPETVPQTIEIGSAEELLAAAARINEGKFENRFDTYLLTADIDLSGVEWTPIGLNNRVLEYWYDYDTERDPNLKGFNGTFDGQGHTISGIYCVGARDNGMFGKMTGTVKNFALVNSVVYNNGTI